MNSSPTFQFLDVVRAGVFLMVSFESYFLGRLYKMASVEMKKSPIISALEILFFSISLIFVTLSIASFVNHLNNFWEDLIKALLIIPAFWVYKSMSKFREMSLDKNMKKQNDIM